MHSMAYLLSILFCVPAAGLLGHEGDDLILLQSGASVSFHGNMSFAGGRRGGVYRFPASDEKDLLSMVHGFDQTYSSVEVKRRPTYQSLTGRDLEDAGVFIDITFNAFPSEWYRWNHSGMPRAHQGTPSFPDFNNDGILDYLYHNHYEKYPRHDWDMGLATGNFIGPDDPYYRSIAREAVTLSEPDDSAWKRPEAAMDTHGTAVLDVDRDGFLDIYMAVGGGDGVVGGPCKYAVLMWGENGSNPEVPRFRGGRNAAEEANLHNAESRGRMNYFADLNGDGLLDVVYVNEPRADNTHAPGYAMLNLGNRTFAEHNQLTEYSNTIVLHDADHDGLAEELVVQRRDCGIKFCLYEHDFTCNRMQDNAPDWLEFCRNHPQDTTAIYKWDSTENQLVMISQPVYREDFGADRYALSQQTGDFDEDGLADLAVLYPDAIYFYLSSKRQRGELPIGEPDDKLTWNKGECNADAFRVADLDNDAGLEMLVLCFNVDVNRGPAHKLYTRWSGSWEAQEASWLGGLVSPNTVHPKGDSVKKLCSGEDGGGSFLGYMGKICREYNNTEIDGHWKEPRSMGLSVVDFNNDGFLDVLVSYDLGRLVMLKNNFVEWGATDNRFLAIRLKGTRSNEYGIGATVLLHVSGTGSDGKQKKVLLREIYSASHETDWLGTRDDRIIFGLGKHGIPEKAVVQWPGRPGKQQVITDQDLLLNKLNNMQHPLWIVED